VATQAVQSLPVHHLDTATYGRMVESGALADAPVELLEGLLVHVSPHSPQHAGAIMALTRHFAQAEAWLRVQLPLEVPPDSVPEPDLALVQAPSPAGHPRTALLAVEVSASSRETDRVVKARVYARAGVPTYWIVDVPGRAVEVHSDPGADGYRRCETYGVGERVPSPAAGVAELDVTELFNDIPA
jgi:Uma2 family endonuclease